jgi:hypothetical protein
MSSSNAAPEIRRKTTEPGVQPLSSNDLAKGPAVANVIAESSAIRMPALDFADPESMFTTCQEQKIRTPVTLGT